MNPNVTDNLGRTCEFLTYQYADQDGEQMRAYIMEAKQAWAQSEQPAASNFEVPDPMPAQFEEFQQ